ncbi:MAG: MFS transporter [Methylibium sp.]|uniref:MFS transporter n=1 Tax=Methylibium sp. TaxID=2067992 RepID=UPI0018430EA7|nr:MFS transporter [Methylibium sp.]MBA3596894.1 MFS transporter [Methylibium sp.]
MTCSDRVRRAALPVTTFVQAASSAAVIGPTVAAPLLLQSLQLGPAAVGLFVALVYLGAMFATQIGAFAVRRWGPIRASQMALLCSTAGLLLLATPLLPLVVLGAFFIGLGYGPITPASSQMLSRTTDPRHYSLVFSIKQTGVPLGGVIAGLFVPPLAGLGGAVGALIGLAVLCLVAAASAAPLAPELDRERDHGAPWPDLHQVLAPMRFVATHAVLRAMALCSFVFSMVQVSLTSYLVSFLTGDLHWTLAAAGAALAVSQVAGVGARIGWGFVSDRWLGPRRVLLGLALGMAGCALSMPLLQPGSPAPLVIALLCVFGATAVGWNGVYLATVARVAPSGQAGTATAGTLFFTFFGVVIGPPVFGAAGAALGALGSAFALLALPLAGGVWVLARARWP